MAVTIGMIFANIVSVNRKWMSVGVYESLNSSLLLPNINISLITDWFDNKTILEALKNDKKREGKDLTLILPSSDKISAVKIHDMTDKEFSVALESLISVLAL